MPPLVGLGSAALVVWTYAAFPAVVLARAVARPRPVRADDVVPTVSVLIAAHDEVAAIGAKLDNVLAADYDPARLEVVVAADGCTDGTQDVVRSFADRGVRLLALPRVGKARALDAALAACSGDVVVFSDANSMLAPDALRRLVRPFADPDVGGVAGDQRYLPAGERPSVAGDGERAYWSLDRMLKSAESRGGSVVSATGALYAVRRELVPAVREGVTDDFWVSTGVVAGGHRLVFEPSAQVFEPVADEVGLEYGRKVRVMTRGLRGVLGRRALLDPRAHGFYAVQLVTHKLLRRLMVVPLGLLLLDCLVRSRRSRPYALAVGAQVVLHGSGALGVLLDRRGRCPRVLAVPAYFALVNAASARALLNLATGTRIDRWEPQRPPAVRPSP